MATEQRGAGVAICAGCAEAKPHLLHREAADEKLQFARDVLRQRSVSWEKSYVLSLQFARDVLRQSPAAARRPAGLSVAICAGCAEAKFDWPEQMSALKVAICAGCAEAKRFRRGQPRHRRCCNLRGMC